MLSHSIITEDKGKEVNIGAITYITPLKKWVWFAYGKNSKLFPSSHDALEDARVVLKQEIYFQNVEEVW